MMANAPATCNGCKHNWYSAPGGQQGYPGCEPILLQPHSRCLALDAYIPMVVEKQKGCDGTTSSKWITSEMPPACPMLPRAMPVAKAAEAVV